MVILNVSASITCAAPEFVLVGESRLVMAWIPCSVPTRTRYSFEVSCARPSAPRFELKGGEGIGNRNRKSLPAKISLVDEPVGFIYGLFFTVLDKIFYDA
jgi:hypothetical protein